MPTTLLRSALALLLAPALLRAEHAVGREAEHAAHEECAEQERERLLFGTLHGLA
jgi:hypothetical protein